MDSKSVFASKTFWVQVLGLVALAVPGLPVSPEVVGYVMAGVTVATRVLSAGGPVHVLPPKAEP